MIFKIFSSLKESAAIKALRALTPAEKMLFWGLTIVLIASSFAILSRINQVFLVDVPKAGGHFYEGIIGSPRFINPLLAITDADRDLTALVYSGLLRATPDGKLINDLAKSYTISEDGLTYTFTLKDDIYFHDGKPVSVEDILFTILKVQDPALKSPKRASWDGVTVEKIDDKQIRFVLTQPYAPFLDNTTIGILPKHVWKDADIEQFPFSQFNIEPIGSGPYLIKKMRRNASGIPIFYEFVSNKNYALGKPYISQVTIVFYANEEALLTGFKKGEIESINSITSDKIVNLINKNTQIKRSPLPRIFAVFFNQNQSNIFTHKEVRKALNVALDKKEIVKKVLNNYGTDIDSPIPPGIIPASKQNEKNTSSTTVAVSTRKERAREILENGGWKWDDEESMWTKKVKKELQILQFSLATSRAPELKSAAEIITKTWQDIGVRVDLQIFETGDLNQNIIRPRKYDALFFGEIVGRELDLFAFWHSSQLNDPGLNIALYANISADKLLEEARTISDNKIRIEKYKKFEEEVANDVPAVFVYSPDFIYIIPKKIKALRLGSITTPSERFLNIHEWYIETDKIWRMFAQ